MKTKDNNIFIMLCGLPSSGKSTYAKKIANNLKAIICSSDAIREELYGYENTQENNEEVFKILHNRIKENLRKGANVIYDATNINSRRRKAFLSELKKIPCIKKCIIMATPFEECIKQNNSRNRIVPYEVISRMYKNWNTPYWFEGWDGIKIHYSTNFYKTLKKDIDSWVNESININQNNPHHSMTLGEHCKVVGRLLKDNELLYCAGLLHDCGKPFTKSFVNSKGEETDIAHYYQHHCVGAYDSLFFSYPDDISNLDVSVLINLHMKPYFWEKDKKYGEKTRQKYQRLWGNKLYNNVMKLYEADKAAH